MKKYRNISGKSGVELYESGNDFIKVKFIAEKRIYVYNYYKPGKDHVDNMKELAVAGKGLSGYISKYVRDNYDHTE